MRIAALVCKLTLVLGFHSPCVGFPQVLPFDSPHYLHRLLPSLPTPIRGTVLLIRPCLSPDPLLVQLVLTTS